MPGEVLQARIDIRVRPMQIPMRYRVKHSCAQRRMTEGLWVEAERGNFLGLGEGCPRIYLTEENLDESIAWVRESLPRFIKQIRDLHALKNFVWENRREIDLHPAAWCAVEIALLDLFGKEQGLSVEELLGVPEERTSFHYTAVLGDEEPRKFERNLVKFLRFGFWDFKFKLSGQYAADTEKIDIFESTIHERAPRWKITSKLAQLFGGRANPPFRVRVDATNFWNSRDEEEVIGYLGGLGFSFSGVEEPFEPRAVDSLSTLSLSLHAPVILDKSVCRVEDLSLFEDARGIWIPNVRVSKVGGILRALEIARRVKELGWLAVVGAQVGETSILSRAALVVARELGSSLYAQEGAFGTRLLLYDPVKPEIRWGLLGKLEHEPGEPGLGLTSISRDLRPDFPQGRGAELEDVPRR